VRIPAGSHRVEFRYQPTSYRVGWIISLVALLVMLGLAIAGLRSRRRARRPVPA